ncbi:MAG: tRNA pseudouridine(55) synthase TruB [Thermotogota bacterium]|nr:tRNA pseudouridine(55) synthase TruB [Thermotogota bacterium]
MASINGILPLYKPIGPTSHDMVSMLRKKLNTKKIGHSGTLDPFAEGVLVMGIGKGTRILEYLKDDKKEYIMTFRLGLLTDTYDIQGQIISDDSIHISEDRIKETVISMLGVQKQSPPIYSAKKYKGKKLYEYAREGKIIKIPPSDIEIYSIDILKINGRDITLKAEVSPGTYMRSLAFDIGLKLSTNATAVKLIRTVNGRFSASECIRTENIDQLKLEDFFPYLKTIDDAISEFPFVMIKTSYIKNVLNGNPIRQEWIMDYGEFKKNDFLRIVSENGQLIAVGCSERNSSFIQTLRTQDRNEIVVKAKKVLRERSNDE